MTLEEAIFEYGKTRTAQLVKSTDLAFRNCAVLAFSFARFLLRNKIYCEVWELEGLPNLETAHWAWRTRQEETWKCRNEAEPNSPINHFVVVVRHYDSNGVETGITWYDWTALQFYANCDLPRIEVLNREDYSSFDTRLRRELLTRTEWDNIKRIFNAQQISCKNSKRFRTGRLRYQPPISIRRKAEKLIKPSKKNK